MYAPSVVVAATSDFTIKWNGVDDTTPPTVPTLLSVSPIAADQIDVVWGSSVDNYFLSGYVLSRDGVPVATTTLTTFSDTGLTASTTYTYSVVAFDYFNNVSGVSNVLATTTLPPPVVVVATSTDGGSGESATKTIMLNELALTPTLTSMQLAFTTNIATRYVLRWGRTDVDDGYIRNDTYKKEHKTEITGLEPGTTYRYEITAYAPNGVAVVLKTGDFTTTALPTEEVVANVTKLQASARDNDVALTYELPTMTAVAEVRIVRSHLGYPVDIADGAVVYEGFDTSFFDAGALVQHKVQYYSVFVIAESGTVSSGAVVRVSQVQTPGDPNEEVATSSATTSVPIQPEIVLPGLELNAIRVLQLGKAATFLDTDIRLSYKDAFTIQIPATALPKHLKSIVVTLLDPTNQRQAYSFLLRLNKDQSAYEATVAPLYVRGVSRLQVEVYDYEEMTVGRYRKQVTFVVMQNQDEETPVVFPDALVSSLRNGLWPSVTLIIVGLAALLFFWQRRSRQAEDNS